MKSEQIKAALLGQWPVIVDMQQSGRIPYKYVSAVIYRKIGEEIGISLEVRDRVGNSVTVVRPERVEIVQDLRSVDYSGEEEEE